MNWELLVAFFILVSILVYTILGGADLGYGILDMLSKGPMARAQQKAMTGSMNSLWEFNHVWLIVVVVLLFTAFSKAFSVLMVALFIPLNLVTLLIIFRGVAFVFRENDVEKNYELWSKVYGISSILLAFLFGAAVAAISGEAIEVDKATNEVTSGYFGSWATPFVIVGGLFAIALCTFLGALSMTLDCRARPELQNYFRERALQSGIGLAFLGLLLLPLAAVYATELYGNFTTWWGSLLLLGALGSASFALLMLKEERIERAWVSGPLAVIILLVGWALAKYPYIIYPTHSLSNSASADITLKLVGITLVVGLPLIIGLAYYLIKVFKLGNDPLESPETKQAR